MIPKVRPLLLLSFFGINPALVPVVAAENQCFADRAELKYAIDVCFKGGLGDELCHTDTDTDVAECESVKETYGWPLNSWCVGEVTDMHFLFVEKRDFNEDISAWDTSKVTNFYEMFSYASSFNCDLSKWDTSKVWKMFGMFNGCEVFDGDISTWNTSSLTDMKWMFYGATVFNGDLSQWDVSQVTDMYEVFAKAPAFNADISRWNVARVTDMSGLFWEAATFNGDLSRWDLSSVTNMEYAMFHGATSFNQDLCAWRETFPYSVARRTFANTACTFQATPQLAAKGPFCASDCGGSEPGGPEDELGQGEPVGQEVNELGKWKDGPPSEVDCTVASSDYDYYIEKCYDETTQWWINGRCINGKKEEVSELHRCMRPDGSRSYCHDCNDGTGNMKNVCGADNPDKEEVCGIAMSSSADCAPQEMAVYSHQCVDQPGTGGANSWYYREEFFCSADLDARGVYVTGPNMEAAPPRPEFTCGQEWYYAFEKGDALVTAANPELADKEHPFASSTNQYCVDCGLAIQVCASEAEATCEDLGLAPRGTDSAPPRESLTLPAPTAAAGKETTVASGATAAPEEQGEDAATEAAVAEPTSGAPAAPEAQGEDAATEAAVAEPTSDAPAAPEAQGEDAATEAAIAEPAAAVPAEEGGEVDGAQAPSSAPLCSPSVLAVGVGISCWWTFFYG